MADRIDDPTGRVQAVEEKVDQLSATVDQLSATVDQLSTSVDRRFDAVDAAFLEQRQYTEFCYSRLEAKMDAGFAKTDAGFAKTDAGFGRLERKLDQFIDVQLQTNRLVDRRLRALEEQRPSPDSPP